MKFNIKSKKGFTLIELLVVIGILAVLAAIAIPSVAGLIDRANVSADNTNANEMTNAIERFASEYELYCQDIASGVFDINDMDSAQSRIYNALGITCRSDIERIEVDTDETVGRFQIAIYRDTKYPANARTAELIVQNYTRTSSSTFEPKQSDMHYWYSPDCGVVVYAKPNANITTELNNQVISGMDAKGNKLDENTQWIDLTVSSSLPSYLTEVSVKTWNGLSSFTGSYIWTDGKNTYYSYENKQYVLNGDTWESKTWNGLTEFNGNQIWTDGKSIYYSGGEHQYVLNGNTWVTKSWNGLHRFDGKHVWKHQSNYYYSYNNKTYMLNGDTWTEKPSADLYGIEGFNVWSDGKNTYFSDNDFDTHYIFANGEWKIKEWTNFNGFSGYYIWSDGANTYYTNSLGNTHKILRNGSWENKTWIGPSDFDGHYIWTDGINTYFSYNEKHYVFN